MQDALYDQQTTTTALQSYRNQVRMLFTSFTSFQSWILGSLSLLRPWVTLLQHLQISFWHENRIIGKECRNTYGFSAQVPLGLACNCLDALAMLANHFNSCRTQLIHLQQLHVTATVTRYARFPFLSFIFYHGDTGSLLHLRPSGQPSFKAEISSMARSWDCW